MSANPQQLVLVVGIALLFELPIIKPYHVPTRQLPAELIRHPSWLASQCSVWASRGRFRDLPRSQLTLLRGHSQPTPKGCQCPFFRPAWAPIASIIPTVRSYVAHNSSSTHPRLKIMSACCAAHRGPGAPIWPSQAQMPGGSVPTSSLIGGPTPATARQGRHKQRYGENAGETVRLVAGCIPIRYPGAAPTPETTEVMLITSRGGGWVFPKGGWEDDETLEAAARRETVEEAGVRGSIEEPLVGTFPFASSKQANSTNRHQGRCLAHMFVMRVAEELETWPEYPQRKRLWVPLAQAGSQLRHQWMRDALQAWINRNNWQQVVPLIPPVSATAAAPAVAAAVAAAAAAAAAAGAEQQQAAGQQQELPASDSGSLSSL